MADCSLTIGPLLLRIATPRAMGLIAPCRYDYLGETAWLRRCFPISVSIRAAGTTALRESLSGFCQPYLASPPILIEPVLLRQLLLGPSMGARAYGTKSYRWDEFSDLAMDFTGGLLAVRGQ